MKLNVALYETNDIISITIGISLQSIQSDRT